MARIVKLTESDLNRIVKKTLTEMMDVSSDSEHYKAREREVTLPFSDLSLLGHLATRFCETKKNLPDCQRAERLYWERGFYN